MLHTFKFKGYKGLQGQSKRPLSFFNQITKNILESS